MRLAKEERKANDKNNEANEKAQLDTRKAYNYDSHINELLKEILSYNRKDGLDKFEELSMYIKKKMTKLSFQYFTPTTPFKSKIELTNFEQNIIKEGQKKKNKTVDTAESYMLDVMNQSRLLEWAGVTFNKTEWYKISLAMKVKFIFEMF